jgi:L-fuconolactonase
LVPVIRIDAHQHYWHPAAPWHQWPDAGQPALFRDFGPADLAPHLARHALAGTVLVQAQPNDAETDWMLDLADRVPTILGVVGWVDFRSPHAPGRMAALARRPQLRGIRPMLQSLPPEWILHPAAAPALRAMAELGLVFEALIRPAHLDALLELARRYPTLTIMVDHAAKPDVAGAHLSDWTAAVQRLAGCDNVACKLSGLVSETGRGWTVEQLRPVVEVLGSGFGPGRLVWGSDWPVLLPDSGYDAWIEAAQALIPATWHDAVFGRNATSVYKLSPALA